MAIDGSSIRGKFTVTPKRSRMSRIQARWENSPSTDRASRSQPIASKRGWAAEKAMNSLVHTGVKSAGCEKNTSQRPR
jgi:hypothetical protein